MDSKGRRTGSQKGGQEESSSTSRSSRSIVSKEHRNENSDAPVDERCSAGQTTTAHVAGEESPFFPLGNAANYVWGPQLLSSVQQRKRHTHRGNCKESNEGSVVELSDDIKPGRHTSSSEEQFKQVIKSVNEIVVTKNLAIKYYDELNEFAFTSLPAWRLLVMNETLKAVLQFAHTKRQEKRSALLNESKSIFLKYAFQGDVNVVEITTARNPYNDRTASTTRSGNEQTAKLIENFKQHFTTFVNDYRSRERELHSLGESVRDMFGPKSKLGRYVVNLQTSCSNFMVGELIPYFAAVNKYVESVYAILQNTFSGNLGNTPTFLREPIFRHEALRPKYWKVKSDEFGNQSIVSGARKNTPAINAFESKFGGGDDRNVVPQSHISVSMNSFLKSTLIFGDVCVMCKNNFDSFHKIQSLFEINDESIDTVQVYPLSVLASKCLLHFAEGTSDRLRYAQSDTVSKAFEVRESARRYLCSPMWFIRHATKDDEKTKPVRSVSLKEWRKIFPAFVTPVASSESRILNSIIGDSDTRLLYKCTLARYAKNAIVIINRFVDNVVLRSLLYWKFSEVRHLIPECPSLSLYRFIFPLVPAIVFGLLPLLYNLLDSIWPKNNENDGTVLAPRDLREFLVFFCFVVYEYDGSDDEKIDEQRTNAADARLVVTSSSNEIRAILDKPLFEKEFFTHLRRLRYTRCLAWEDAFWVNSFADGEDGCNEAEHVDVDENTNDNDDVNEIVNNNRESFNIRNVIRSEASALVDTTRRSCDAALKRAAFVFLSAA